MSISCKHGQLARSCNICELEEDKKKLQKENIILKECLEWLRDRHHGGLMRAKIDDALQQAGSSKS